ncbi:MAG: glycosyltransferase family 2 protein, partial [Candidatus Roizmanbacteria bacterium]|nr:glycosyltransferase family 2 protein [Candidatus Roizmanbacteria bacterium]
LAPQSMPLLHKYIGRPLFAFIIRYIFGVPVYDSHSGFGAIKKSALQQLTLRSTGMEFASEILITAYRNNVQIVSTPIYYAHRIGKSKLHTFRDGLRHLHYMGKVLLFP